MRALERRYSKSERIIARAKFSPWFYLHNFNLAVVLGAIIALLWVFNQQIEGFFTKDFNQVTILTESTLKWITVGAACVAAAMFIVISISLYCREVIVTEDKVIMRKNIIAIESVAIHINKIKSVEFDMNIVQRFFNYGKITIIVDGNRPYYITRVVSPERFAKKVMEQVSKNTNERANQIVRLQLAGSVPKKNH